MTNAPKNNGNGDLNAKIQEIQPLLTKISELKASYTNADTARKEEMKTEFEDTKAKIIALQEEINGFLTEMTIETNVLTFFQESYPEYMESLQKLNILDTNKKNMGALVSTNNNQQIAAANTQQVNTKVNAGKNENGRNNQTNGAANNQNRPNNQTNGVANNQNKAPTVPTTVNKNATTPNNTKNKNATTPNNTKNKNATTPNNTKNKNATTTVRANNGKNNAVTGGKRKTRKLNKRK
jgi:hypothetical protein